MKIFSMFLLSLLIVSCQGNEKVKVKQPEQSPPSRKHTPPPPPPPPPKEKSQEQPPLASKNKIEEELTKMENDLRRIVQGSLTKPKPTMRVDEIKKTDGEMVSRYTDLDCEETAAFLNKKFKLSQIENYANSYHKTGKTDGRLFCLQELPEIKNARIIYGRNEGGHYSDQIQLIGINKEAKAIYYLPLVYWFGKEGYECSVESELVNSTQVKRTIIEKLGWKRVGDEDGSEQPRSETLQVFEILSNGKIQLMNEQIHNYNFEKYVNEKI